MKPLDRRRFDALPGYSRSPYSVLFADELAWLAESDEKLLEGIVREAGRSLRTRRRDLRGDSPARCLAANTQRARIALWLTRDVRFGDAIALTGSRAHRLS